MATTPLKSLVLEMIRQSGPITFERYMDLCLYQPEFGYYMQGRDRTGAAGDYFTSPDLHPIFARLVARQATEMWDVLARPTRFTWVEMGAGRGLFAVDFINWVQHARPDFLDALEYVVVEPAPKQRANVIERATEAALHTRIRAITSLEEINPVTGCFFSNELVDAFPVSVVTRARGRLKEIYVAAEEEDLRESTGPISDSAVAAAVARYANQLEEGQRAEVNRRAELWISSVAEKLGYGFLVTIDYGDLAPFLFTARRPRGTLLTYREHAVSEDFYAAPGEQDLTAHVNFSALMDAGKAVGLETLGFTTQERFLMGIGEDNQFADLYEPVQTEQEKLQARLKLKRLIFPGGTEGERGMGSVFKVLVQGRGVGTTKLTGLKFQPQKSPQT